jgi:hypothetical protein
VSITTVASLSLAVKTDFSPLACLKKSQILLCFLPSFDIAKGSVVIGHSPHRRGRLSSRKGAGISDPAQAGFAANTFPLSVSQKAPVITMERFRAKKAKKKW